MRRVLSLFAALALALPLAAVSPLPALAETPADASSKAGPTVKELENELAGIEKELSVLQQKVDLLLQDLVDPRLTTVSVFFATEPLKDRVPLALEVLLNGRPLVTRQFSETDRLILAKGGSLEIHTGIVDARQQSMTFRCTVSAVPGQPGDMAASTFGLDPVRATKNFVEVELARGADPKIAPFVLTAKTWSRE
jgi:hypothetical protein